MNQHEHTQGDAAAVSSALGTLPEPLETWARASFAEAQAEECASRGLDDGTALYYREALACYDELGSRRDSARVRMHLRDLGIRVRHWTYEERPLWGWNSMTATEQRIAELVALGLTNREVGREMFISSHTVAFHLRQVFRKLDIGSRVALARLSVERNLAARSAV
jgi:DNA-binding CsgD family transcriptional regulator